jgi:hypothetical protein
VVVAPFRGVEGRGGREQVWRQQRISRETTDTGAQALSRGWGRPWARPRGPARSIGPVGATCLHG